MIRQKRKVLKIYFNTHTFDELIRKYKLPVTVNPKEAVLLVLGAKKVNFSEFNNLKGVYRFGIGTENIDFEFLKQRSIRIYFPGEETKKILYDSTANFTVYAILNILYREAFGDTETWKKNERNYIGYKTALVIGTGNIGRRVAEKLKVFMKVKTYDICSNMPEDLEPLVRSVDVITIHIPLNSDTEHFFDERKLSWVKDDAIIVNTARGCLFDENALYNKLQTSNCYAFFDVFWQEPYKGKLKTLGDKRFLMTPHTASNTKEFIMAAFKEILKIWEELANA